MVDNGTQAVTLLDRAIGLTYSDFRRLPDDGYRYELLDGLLVKEPAPATPHQAVVRRLLDALLHHLDPIQKEGLFIAPIAVVLSATTVVQPDVLYIRLNRLEIVREEAILGAPDVVFEILSSSTRARDLTTKHDLYALHGVDEYWIVDRRERRVYAYQEPMAGRYTNVVPYAVGEHPPSRVLAWSFDVRALFGPY